MKILKLFIISLTFLLVTSFKLQENNVEGLVVTFRKVSEDYLKPGIPNGLYPSFPIEASEGMKFVKLKLTLKNNGKEDCIFKFSEVYISTEQDSLYPSVFLLDKSNSKTKIKPNKEIKSVLFFEFPDKAKPKELFIENKRYKIIEERK